MRGQPRRHARVHELQARNDQVQGGAVVAPRGPRTLARDSRRGVDLRRRFGVDGDADQCACSARRQRARRRPSSIRQWCGISTDRRRASLGNTARKGSSAVQLLGRVKCQRPVHGARVGLVDTCSGSSDAEQRNEPQPELSRVAADYRRQRALRACSGQRRTVRGVLPAELRVDRAGDRQAQLLGRLRGALACDGPCFSGP